jgi:hypothetical protein
MPALRQPGSETASGGGVLISSQDTNLPLTSPAKATFDAISKICSYLTSDLWKDMVSIKCPYKEFTNYLIKTYATVCTQMTQARA